MKSAEEHGVSENDIQGAECDEREGPSRYVKKNHIYVGNYKQLIVVIHSGVQYYLATV